MPLFQRRQWSASEIPDLTFREDRLCVDIGFLGGEEHRSAFSAIFAKLLRDNAATLSGMDLLSVAAKRSVSLPPEVVTKLPTALAVIDVDSLARVLYDSHNEKVILQLRGPRGDAQLGVRFDDPEFWFEEAAA